ncbi:starch synthase 4 [Populus alba x Populus x berolinensis]|nr:starch synthase 4 [Populus alba x Populus x berolinensis]
MESVINSTILSLAGFPKSNPSIHHQKTVKARRTVYCSLSSKNSNNGGDANGLLKEEEEEKYNDTWLLFKEAQQNILYLNKLRLVAVEELNKANREKQLLLDKIQQLGAVNKLGNEQSLWRELLLRIDSMVLTGLIDSAEASGMRKAVMGNKFSVALVFFDIRQKTDAELLAQLRQFSDGSRKNGFHIIQICTEMEPLVSVGSLSSYVTGLSKALQKKGHMVEVILPKYACLDLTEMQGLREIEAELYSYFNGQLHGNRIWTGIVHGIAVTLIQPLYYSSFFDRERVYGYSDDFERFTYFSRASLDYIAKSGKQPDVLHIHNWETAIVGPLFWDIFVKQGLGGTRVLLTCHGFDSQCLEQPDKLALCGLDPARLHRPDRLQDHTMTHLVNILKGGLVYSNKVVMVQSIYSKERIINSFGHGLEPTLAIHKDKLLVSPCGFDNSTWDPSKDKFLPKNYSADDLKGKSICKVALQQQLGLSKNSSTVLVGCICTESLDFDLNNQKAVWNATQKSVQVCTSFWDLYFFEENTGLSAEYWRNSLLVGEMRVLKKVTRTVILNFPWQPHESFIFMGSKATSADGALEYLKKELKDETVRFINKYDEALLHLIFAGSDIILCQSFHDPLLQVPVSRELFSSKQNLQCICFFVWKIRNPSHHLHELKALKYGAAPVAVTSNENKFRHFVDHEQETSRFSRFISSTFGYLSLSQAVDEIKNSPSKWKQKIVDAMAKDFSWNAECYDVHVSAYTALKSL